MPLPTTSATAPASVTAPNASDQPVSRIVISEEVDGNPSIRGTSTKEGDLFNHTVQVINTAGAALDSKMEAVFDATAAALSNWAQFMNGAAGSVLDVRVVIEDVPNNFVAGAAPTLYEIADPDAGGVLDLRTAAQVELQTGRDIDENDQELFIIVGSEFLTNAVTVLDSSDDRVLPNNRSIDLVSVMTHEIAHGLGFTAFDEPLVFDVDGDGDVDTSQTTFGRLIDKGEDGTTRTFTGENTVALFGAAVPLAFDTGSSGSDLSHFERVGADGALADTATALQNPSVVRGDIVTIGALELSVMRDLGYDVVGDEALDATNQVDRNPPPVISISDEVAFFQGLTFLTLTRDKILGENFAPTSVGIEVTDQTGQVTTLRSEFRPGTNAITVGFDADAIATTIDANGITRVSGDIDVRLFAPIQGELAGGDREVTVTLQPSIVAGTTGNDRLFGTAQGDFIRGDAGNDVFYGSAGSDVIAGDAGFDRVYYRNSDAGVRVDLLKGTGLGGSAEGDTLNSIELVWGSGFNDVLAGSGGREFLFGGGGQDRLFGRGGNDELRGGAGADVLNGQNGIDVASYVASNAGVRIDLFFGTTRGGEAEGDTLVAIENLTGSRFNDKLLGDNGANALNGKAGNDALAGRGGNDVLLGEAGNDRLWGGTGVDRLFGGDGDDRIAGQRGNDILVGGAGADQFVFRAGDGNDRITDFELGIDRLSLVGIADNFADVTITDSARGALAEFDTASVLLEGLSAGDLSAGDFLFGTA